MEDTVEVVKGVVLKEVQANRAQRRALGFRGPAFRHTVGFVPRYVMRHYLPNLFALNDYPNFDPVGPGVFTRRQRKARARIMRAMARRGMNL